MSKPPKLDFKALVAGTAPQIEAPAEPTRPVVKFKPRRAAPPERAGGTLKERAHQMSVYLEAPVYEKLRDIAHTERVKLHGLMLEGIDLMLRKRGQPSVRQLLKEGGE